MTKTIQISDEALKVATNEQLERIAILVSSPAAKLIEVQMGGFGLPDGYLGFRVDYNTGNPMYGGIDVDGCAST